ncbi:MAG: hypothetical protein AAF657_01675 [Acidobacteriota bacterium]
MSDAKLKSGIRLTKEERKELLAQLERQSSRTESAERILQRGEQALKDGRLDQARRVLTQLESRAPTLAGLDVFRQSLEAAAGDNKRQANLRTTEEMLARYIQQRKKPLAELALATLIDLAPSHPRRSDYEIWVADLDQELAVQRRIEEEAAAGRAALRAGDLARAGKHLATLRKVDPDSGATESLAAEIASAEQGQAESAGIERTKQRLEELLAAGELDEAERQMEALRQMDIPKVTIDFLRQRLEQGRGRLRDAADEATIVERFEQRLTASDWPGAREVAQQFSHRFPTSARGAELFNRANDLEARERRQQSLAEGLATLERFIAARDRNNAQLALKLLSSLDLDPAQLAQLEARVRAL